MISFFPDLNVWLALSVAGHVHSQAAWRWLALVGDEARLGFSRYTQLGLLRLLTSEAVMGNHTLTIGKAWSIYERWLDDPRVEFWVEPTGVGPAFHRATDSFRTKAAPKALGDCYLLAYAAETGSTLVTFDGALLSTARKLGHPALIPA